MPVPEEEVVAGEIMPQPTEDSDSGESYEASSDDTAVSAGDIEVTFRVTHASKAFLGRCF